MGDNNWDLLMEPLVELEPVPLVKCVEEAVAELENFLHTGC